MQHCLYRNDIRKQHSSATAACTINMTSMAMQKKSANALHICVNINTLNIATLWVHHSAVTVLSSTSQGKEASEEDRVTSEDSWVNPHSEY